MESVTSFEIQARRNRINKALGYGLLWLSIIVFIEVIPTVLGELSSGYHVLAIGMLFAAARSFRNWLLLRKEL